MTFIQPNNWYRVEIIGFCQCSGRRAAVGECPDIGVRGDTDSRRRD
jgi:hypothetical protein